MNFTVIQTDTLIAVLRTPTVHEVTILFHSAMKQKSVYTFETNIVFTFGLF